MRRTLWWLSAILLIGAGSAGCGGGADPPRLVVQCVDAPERLAPHLHIDAVRKWQQHLAQKFPWDEERQCWAQRWAFPASIRPAQWIAYYPKTEELQWRIDAVAMGLVVRSPRRRMSALPLSNSLFSAEIERQRTRIAVGGPVRRTEQTVAGLRVYLLPDAKPPQYMLLLIPDDSRGLHATCTERNGTLARALPGAECRVYTHVDEAVEVSYPLAIQYIDDIWTHNERVQAYVRAMMRTETPGHHEE